MLRAMLAGEVGGVFGYVTTATAHAAAGGIDLGRIRFIRYADHLPDFYGHALMVSRRLAREEPGFVTELVRAVNLGLRDTVRDPAAGIGAVARRDPSINRDIERGRLMGTFAGEMSHPEATRIGIGAVDPDRLARGIALHAETKRLARTPALGEVFNPAFLPPRRERVTAVPVAPDLDG
jgi:NitT/TauT family transport system substrate-binding protein